MFSKRCARCQVALERGKWKVIASGKVRKPFADASNRYPFCEPCARAVLVLHKKEPR